MSRLRRHGLWHNIGKLHWPLLLLTFALCATGFALLYSASNGEWQPWALPQIIRFCIGLIAMFGIALMPIEWLMHLSLPLYILTLILLVIVDLFGTMGMGAQRWLDLGFFILQPSEPAKLAVILILARYFHRLNYEQIGKLWTVAPPLIMIGIPCVLILLQPNLGTATILTGTAVAILFAAGIRWWKFLVVGVLAACAAPIGWLFLHDYQKRRVLTFLEPEADPLGAGYNILQSQIAIGSGDLWGRGFMQGPQGQLDFLPEKHTDFIFTMLAEEFGFMGSLVLLASYAALLWTGYRISLTTHHHFGRLIAFGITTYFFLHIFINMAMVMGMIPVVGVPLPFLSYGGTTLLTSQLAIGLLLNAHLHREERLQRMSHH